MAQTQIFRGTARKTFEDFAQKDYYYHNTAVVIAHRNGDVTLNSGGYKNATTKTAMNQASNQDKLGFSVSQVKGDWFVTIRHNGQVLPFEDGMRFQTNHTRYL